MTDAPFRSASGEQLRRARAEAGVSQQIAATHIDISISTLRAAESGRTELRYSQTVALAALYQCTVDDLVAPAEATA